MPTIDDTNNRIYVSGLAPGTNKDDLIELFGRIGESRARARLRLRVGPLQHAARVHV